MQTPKSSAGRLRGAYLIELRERFGRLSLCDAEMVTESSGGQRKPYQVAGGIAIINISGVLVNEASWWDETEYGDIQQEVAMAVADDQVHGILLRVNSPGGETSGAFEAAHSLIAAGKQKPVWSVADPIAYSGGYLMAIAGEKIYVPPITGGVGSIGVRAEHWNFQKALEKAGIEVEQFSAGEGKTAGNPYEPLTKAARAQLQGEIDRLYAEFVGMVADSRKMTAEKIHSLGAWLYDGKERALGSGLADRAGSFEDALAEMAAHVQQSSMQILFTAPAASAAAQSTAKEAVIMPEVQEVKADAVVAAPPDLDKTRAEAMAAGLSAAVEVIDLCMIAGCPNRAGDFIKAGTSASDVRAALLTEKARAHEQEISSTITPEAGGDAEDEKKLEAKMAERKAAQIAARKGGR